MLHEASKKVNLKIRIFVRRDDEKRAGNPEGKKVDFFTIEEDKISSPS